MSGDGRVGAFWLSRSMERACRRRTDISPRRRTRGSNRRKQIARLVGVVERRGENERIVQHVCAARPSIPSNPDPASTSRRL